MELMKIVLSLMVKFNIYIIGVNMEGGTLDPNTLTIRLVQEVTIPLKPLIFKWNH